MTRTENDEFQPGPSGGVEEAEHDRLFERLCAGMTAISERQELVIKEARFGRESTPFSNDLDRRSTQ
jgi:hypothetical protein